MVYCMSYWLFSTPRGRIKCWLQLRKRWVSSSETNRYLRRVQWATCWYNSDSKLILFQSNNTLMQGSMVLGSPFKTPSFYVKIYPPSNLYTHISSQSALLSRWFSGFPVGLDRLDWFHQGFQDLVPIYHPYMVRFIYLHLVVFYGKRW